LRVSRYLEDKPKDLTQSSLVVRLEYSDGKKTLGFMELFKVAGPPGDKPADAYLVRTENTRWYAEVLASRAEQIARDLSSVVTQASK
jgi:hypothetical protein